MNGPKGSASRSTVRVEQAPALHGISIRLRLIILSVVVSVFTLAALLVMASNGGRNVIRRAQDAASQSLSSQSGAYLLQINQSAAAQSALILDRAARDVKALAEATQIIYNGEANLPAITGGSTGAASTPVSMTVGAEGQYMNGASELSSIFVPNTAMQQAAQDEALAEAIRRDIELSSYLDITLKAIKVNNPDAAAVFLGTRNDMTRYFPNIRLGEVVPPDFQVSGRPWYTSAVAENGPVLGADQQPRPVWSPVYADATGKGLVATVAMPAYDQQGSLIGVAGLDITLNEIARNIDQTRMESGYSFLIDEEGNAIVLPEAGYLDFLGRAARSDEIQPNLRQETSNPEISDVIDRMVRGERGFKRIAIGEGVERQLFIAYAPLQSSAAIEGAIPRWSLGSVIYTEDIFNDIATLRNNLNQTIRQTVLTQLLPLVLIILAGLSTLIWIIAGRMVNPLLRLASAARMMSESSTGPEGSRIAREWGQAIGEMHQVEKQSSDEIGLLAHTLVSVASQLEGSFESLEQRVAERTEQLEHRSLQLQTAAEVAQEIALARSLDNMLDRAVDLICDRFGYYHTAIFLIDETGEYAYLRAAGGAGSGLLAEGPANLRLRVGQQGMVGYVARYGHYRLADDVTTERVFLANPLLPETRSEVALPLRTGPKIVGVLDVQSTRLAEFSEDDVLVLQTLADQLAGAIENVRLLSQLQHAIEEASLLYEGQVQQSWKRLTARSGGPIAFEYDQLEVKSAPVSESLPKIKRLAPASGQAADGSALQVPLRLRDQVIGFIGVESEDPNHHWSEDEMTIIEATANQAAQTLENARLLAESQRKAAYESLAAEVTSRMRASLDIEMVVNTAMREISQKLGIAQVEVHLGAPAGPGHAETGQEMERP